MNLAYCMEECKDTKPRTGCLAAGLKVAAVSDGDAEVFVRIDWSVVDANFVVKMWTGGAAAETDIADRVAAMNALARCDGEPGEMAIPGRDAMAMIHHNGLTVSAHEFGERNYAIGGRNHRMPIAAADINATVKCSFPVEGINALAKTSRDLAFDRPEIGCGIGAVPVGRGGVASQSEADSDRGIAGECGSAQHPQLVERRSYVSIVNFLLSSRDQGGLRL